MKKIIISRSLVLLFIAAFLVSPAPARAANLTNAVMRLNRMTESQTNVTALVVINPATTAVEDVLRITFANTFDVDSVAVNVGGITSETVAGVAVTALPSLGTATITGQQVDIAFSGATAPGTLYGVYITGIGTPTAGQQVHTITTRASGSDVDTSKVATRLVTNDQVVITGTVPPTFNLTLSANTDSFTADLDPAGIISTSGVTVTASTNAINGWSAWLRSANTSLDSVTTGQAVETYGTINATTTLIDPSDTNEYYQLDVSNPTEGTNGTSTAPIVAAEYDGDATHGGTFSTSFQEIAYGNGTTDGDAVTLIARAVPGAIRAAATDYTDTWTIVGAANF